jgi:hypothetical protein
MVTRLTAIPRNDPARTSDPVWREEKRVKLS